MLKTMIQNKKNKNNNQLKKKSCKLSIFEIKKRQKKSKGKNLIKQTNVRYQKVEGLN